MTIKLQPKYYDYVKNGTKRIELRLNDEKRQLIKIGDEIKILKEPNLDESIKVKVTGLLKYASFEDLFKDFEVDILADKSENKENILKDLEIYYSKEKQEEYNVLGIRFELI